MDLLFLFSLLVTVFSLALTLIGLPAQILKNHREKRSGQPLLTVSIALGFYASQIGLFALTSNWFPFVSFVVGFAMWSVLFVQHYTYSKK
jgi:tetrahydromethanopterin S-methyltransferase subunit C